MPDPFHLDRFLTAQGPLLDRIRDELRAGVKRTHWMWFVFPQLAGLGRSDTARFYAIRSLDEARSYLAHPILGARLIECAALVNGVEAKSALVILGSPDDLKFHSSMTLFATASPSEPEFSRALRKYFGGAMDRATLELLVGLS
jgi:uncharacterized protein (DUF1810 family)